VRTARLIARRPRSGDAPALAAIYATPEAERWLPARDPVDMLARDLANWERDGFGRWYWEERDSGELVARCGPGPADIEGVAEVELHWSVRPDRFGRGYATEAAVAAAEAYLAEQQAASVVAFAHVGNLPSQAVARRAGFTREREFVLDGQPYVLYRRYSSASASLNASSSGSSIE
jgi:RimJ/RimL family protein N-acetyltransferase